MYIVCPFSRSHESGRISAMVLSQSVTCKLVVVVNGGARYEGVAHHVITLEGGGDACAAMNAGLTFVRDEDPESIFARWDDDDDYRPDYMQEVQDALGSGAHYSGIPRALVQLTDGSSRELDDGGSGICSGGTLAGRVKFAANFRDFPADDYAWCQDMRGYGLTFAPRSSVHYRRIRHEGCATSHMTDNYFKLLFKGVE